MNNSQTGKIGAARTGGAVVAFALYLVVGLIAGRDNLLN